MKKLCYIFLLSFGLGCSNQAHAQDNEKICSQRFGFCFQIPPNYFMLSTNDIESKTASYKTVDGSSTIEIVNGSLAYAKDFHVIYLMVLGLWTEKNYRITLKKEYNDFFVFSGYTNTGRGFYQKVIKLENNYASAYLEFPKGNKKYSNVSQMLFDSFQKTVIN